MSRRVTDQAIANLEKLARVHRDVSLAEFSRWRIGGRAPCLVQPASLSEISAVRSYLNDNAIPCFIVGHTSNLLFDDQPADYVLLQISDQFANILIDDRRVLVQGGAWVPNLAIQVGRVGLTGIEHIVGIPGTIGGLVCMNGGSKRQSIGTHVVEVTCVGQDGNVCKMSKEECGFGYRTSRFQESTTLVASTTLELELDDWPSIRSKMRQILKERRKKFPRKLPNCGSVFVSDPVSYKTHGPPGVLIEKAGLKGTIEGGAMISAKHANFFVNTGHATAVDILLLIGRTRMAVMERFDHKLQCEVRFVTSEGQSIPAHRALRSLDV